MPELPVKYRKKLIEVSIPLEAINNSCVHEKSIRSSHLSSLHLWWARRPLAAARAILLCQLIDDPGQVPERFETEKEQDLERTRIFHLISAISEWDNCKDSSLLQLARQLIQETWERFCLDNGKVLGPIPSVHDPFSGGGAIPFEAQRLGLTAIATDLNPVPVLLNKAAVDIPCRVTPEPCSHKLSLGEDCRDFTSFASLIRYYGDEMRRLASDTVGKYWKEVAVQAEECRPEINALKGKLRTPIAWIWCRTVETTNPYFAGVHVPLVKSFCISQKAGQITWVYPSYSETEAKIVYTVRRDAQGPVITGTVSRAGVKCIASGDSIPLSHVRDQAKQGLLGTALLAVVIKESSGRVYLSPSYYEPFVEKNIENATCQLKDINIEHWSGCTNCVGYGLTTFGSLFTDRQRVTLAAFCDRVEDIRKLAYEDALQPEAGSWANKNAESISEGVAVYMTLAIGKLADLNNSMCRWEPRAQCPRNLFGKQAIPMVWDFAEANPLSSSSGSWNTLINGIANAYSKCIDYGASKQNALVAQADVSNQELSRGCIISTDPPYYDNVPYSNLSDFFYLWHRQCLGALFPELYSTVCVPRAGELVATASRHGGKPGAEKYFLGGMTAALGRLAELSTDAYPMTIYYAFKQSETSSSTHARSSTGWQVFLEAIVSAGLVIEGTWPISTENSSRMMGQDLNAVSSSIVLVCKRRSKSSSSISRQDFRRELKNKIPLSLMALEKAGISPVDIAQAVIGPGMAIFSGATVVLNPDDSHMSVREALIEINAALDEYLSQDEGDLDADSRFALTFFESYGYEERSYGDAEGLAIARNLSVDGVAEAGILSSVAGKVRLYQRAQLPEDWDPTTDRRLCVWEATQHLIKRLEDSGESSASELLLQLKNISGHGDLAANCRALAYRLYNHCEKKKQAEEARAYNGLVIAWPELERLASASSISSSAPRQTTLI